MLIGAPLLRIKVITTVIDLLQTTKISSRETTAERVRAFFAFN